MNDIKEKIADYINQHKSSLLYNIDHRSIEQSVMGLINGNKAAGNILNIDDTTIKERVYKEIGQQETKQALQIKEEGVVVYSQNSFVVSPRPAVYHDNGTTQPPQQQEKLQINSFDMRILSKYKLIFKQCELKFELNSNYPTSLTFHHQTMFFDCVFNAEYIIQTLSTDVFAIKNCTFNKNVYFSNAKFCNNVYFNNSHFKGYADFHECEFEKTACFYGATFDNPPNFSQAIFKENLNMVNTNLNFNFDGLNVKIEQEYEYFNKNKREENKKSLDKFANDFRDSFRLIKSALIKDNNLLDASNFHKYEPYCKEIELEQIWHRQGKSAETEVDTRRNTQKFRDYIECLLLGFYRKLCDHHTDFLKVFNNLVLLIALYILFSLSFAHTRDIETILVSLKYPYITVGSFIYVFLRIVLLKYSKKLLIFTKEKQCEKNYILMLIKDFYYLIKSLFLALFFTCIFYVLYELVRKNQLSCNDFGYSVFTNVSFISLYLCLVYTKSLYFGRYILVFICYILLLVNFIENPIIIHPLIRKIGDISIGSSPSTIALNISYTILIGLVLFSLQKTARKNSIVPH